MSRSMLFEDGQVVELRCLNAENKNVLAGFFSDLSLLAHHAKEQSGKWTYVSVTLNEINPALFSRCANRMKSGLKSTADADVISRRWFPIDFDPHRPADISSSEAEHQRALDAARACRQWLTDQGWPEPILADSGNGAHLLYRVALPNSEEITTLFKGVTAAIALFHETPEMDVDRVVVNPSRVWKCYGTLACKGDSTPERPHRQSKILEHPETCQLVSLDLFQALAALVPLPPPEEQSYRRDHGRPTFNLDAWIEKSGLPIAYTGDYDKGRKWILNPCPWNPDHTNDSAFIIQRQDGTIQAGCRHNGCANNHWHELRDVVEPGWRSTRATTPTFSSNGHHQPQEPPPTPEPPPERQEPPQDAPAPSPGIPAFSVAELTLQAYQDAAALAASGRLFFGLDCGFDALNEKLNGLCPGELTVLAGRPSMGKTTIALQMALHVAQTDKVPVGIVSLEMTIPQVGAKMCGIISQVDPYRQRRGRLTQDEQLRYFRAINDFSRLPVWTFSEARTAEAVEGLFVQHPEVKLWIVDHLHRMKGPGDSKHEELGTITEELDHLTKKYNKHMLLLAQLNRECESRHDKMPQIGDLRGSGSIEEHAVNVLMLYRPGQYQELRAPYRDNAEQMQEFMRKTTVLIEKGRFEGVGAIPLVWITEQAIFGNPSFGDDLGPRRDPVPHWQGDR